MRLVVAPDSPSAADLAASWIAFRLRDAVRRRGEATIAFSGGSTPVPMLARLATLDVPWRHVRAYQVDERVAPDGDAARNAGLLGVLPLAKRQVVAMPVTARNLRAAARRYGAMLPPRFDVIDLGVGDDGHTASWPPGDAVVDTVDPVAVVGPFNGHLRMTLTPGVVNAARSRQVLVTGEAKAAAVHRWLSGGGGLPIDRVRRTNTRVVLDAAAAALLAHH